MQPDDATLYQAPEDQEQSVRKSQVGHVIAGYTLTEMLGAGSFGEVWAGVQTRTGQKVALKVFTHLGGLDWQYFQREIERLRDVAEHPHIVTLLDADLQHDPPYLAMPLLTGGSLSAQAAESLPSNEQVAAWLEQIAGPTLTARRCCTATSSP